MTSAEPRARPSSILLVGAGKMGAAMLEGWIAVGTNLSTSAVVDPQPSLEVQNLCEDKGIALNPFLGDMAPPEAVVLAVKPQMLDAVAPSLNKAIGPATLLVSILAGKTIADLQRQLPHARAIVRAMPNLAASIRRSATGAAGNSDVSQRQKALADRLLAGIGTVEWLPNEDLIDAVTAVSGSGPAYFFLLTECLAQAGATLGLPRELAERLARATAIGAGALLAESELPAAKLRHNVTSPGGTTAAALDVLMGQPGLADLMGKAVAAAKRRAEELSG
jgi:pyrroline-5-carboxylate reductase